jgi:hypothetical protein
MLYTYIQKVICSNLDWDTSYLEWGFVVFLSPSNKCQNRTSISPCTFPSKSFLIRHSSDIHHSNL